MVMTLPWLLILRDALDLELGPRPRIATLATVDSHHRPRARSVVMRQIDDDDGALHVVSDARSDKNGHLRQTPFAELVFWLPTRQEQFRLAGPARITTEKDDPALLQHFWSALPDASRALFAWPPPGRPRPASDEPFVPALAATTPVPDTFELITVRPDQVEYLELAPAPHRRLRWRAQVEWQPEEINP